MMFTFSKNGIPFQLVSNDQRTDAPRQIAVLRTLQQDFEQTERNWLFGKEFGKAVGYEVPMNFGHFGSKIRLIRKNPHDLKYEATHFSLSRPSGLYQRWKKSRPLPLHEVSKNGLWYAPSFCEYLLLPDQKSDEIIVSKKEG